jgi:hypothetical protein
MYVKYLSFNVVEWIKRAQGGNWRWNVVTVLLNTKVPLNADLKERQILKNNFVFFDFMVNMIHPVQRPYSD